MLWARHAQEGAARGMWVHLEFEALLNGHIMSRQSSEIEFFLAFISTLRDCVAYRTLRILANSLVQFLPEVVFFAKRRDGRKFFTNSPIFFSHPHQEGSRRLVFLPLFYHGFQFFFCSQTWG